MGLPDSGITVCCCGNRPHSNANYLLTGSLAAGCGLPPGPGGSLGAAEGMAYLTVGALALWSVNAQLRTGQGLPAGEHNDATATAYSVLLPEC